MQPIENYRDYKQKIHILTENVFFSILNLPQSMERRVGRLLQKIRSKLDKEDLSKLDVFYLALEKGLAQMEALIANDILPEHEFRSRGGASVTDLSVIRNRNLAVKGETNTSEVGAEAPKFSQERG